MASLRRRAIVGGAVWALGCVLICGFVLFIVLDRISVGRFENALLDRHLQVVLALERSSGDPDVMDVMLPDQGFRQVYSGRYWQITTADTLVASASLFDATLDTPADAASEPILVDTAGPDGDIRVAHQRIALEDGTDWWVSTAESLASLRSERALLLNSLLISFGLIVAFGVLGATLQVSTALKPLAQLRDEVLHRWDRGETIDPEQYPDEVAPLIDDINAVIRNNRQIISGARRQAADLAHALKTPTAILRNELDAAQNDVVSVGPLSDALDRIDAQIKRSLARMRAANGSANAAVPHFTFTELDTTLARLARAFQSLHSGAGVELVVETCDPVSVRMDRQDLEEVLGNLLDNATKWCRKTVHLRTRISKNFVELVIEDDGPGIPETQKRTALVAGGRLDTQSEGTGLGLAIATDLLQAYDGALELGKSETLGGLRVMVTLERHLRSGRGKMPARAAEQTEPS